VTYSVPFVHQASSRRALVSMGKVPLAWSTVALPSVSPDDAYRANLAWSVAAQVLPA
jgi:hypothetical protein